MQSAQILSYEGYKKSNIQCIGEMPNHWNLERTRFLLQFSKGLTITKDDLQESGVPCVNYGEIHSKYGFVVDAQKDELKCVSLDYLNTHKGALLQSGDFVFADTSEDIEGSGNFTHLTGDIPTFAGYHTVIARHDDRVVTRYLAYVLESMLFRKQIRKAVKGVKVYSISQGLLKNTNILLPPIPEQTMIATFLDEKTAKIDEAIAIKERQTSLLKERRQIIIQNAVTKGLNPDAPMKDSGVDWISQIPAHWEIKRNASIFIESKRPGFAALPVLSVSIHSGVSDRELSDEENIRSAIKIEDRTSYKMVKPGFVTYNMMRAWQGGIGSVRTLGMVSPAYVVLEPKIEVDSDFFEHLYRTPPFIWQMDCNSKGITDFRKRLYWEEFRILITILPPILEQRAIVANIKRLAEKIDRDTAIKQQQIEALKEYKMTLINSAVTGKIKLV